LIKLTQHQLNEHRTLVRVDGRLDAHGAEQLAEMLRGLPSSGSVTLNLAGLESVDSAGRTALIDLRRAGHQLTGGSMYIRQLLEEAQP
jgi:anti-anti-sigma regulatory factor